MKPLTTNPTRSPKQVSPPSDVSGPTTQSHTLDDVDVVVSQEELVTQREGHITQEHLALSTSQLDGASDSNVDGDAKSQSFLSLLTATMTQGPQEASMDGWAGADGDVAFLHDVMSDATSIARGRGPEGSEPLLTAHDTDRLNDLFASLSPETTERIASLAESFSGESAGVARGLLLRAVVARASVLEDSPHVMDAIQLFADSMEGMSSDELLTKATVLDLDSTQNTSDFDPIPMWERRGTIHDRTEIDTHTNNDGLYQRFTASCGPAALQMALAEADPLVAFAIHDAGLTSDSSTDEVAAFQKTLLESFGGVAIGRREALLRARLRNATGRLVQHKHITPKQADTLRDFALQQGALSSTITGALDVMREQFDGFPSDAELDKLRANVHPERDEGLDEVVYTASVNEFLGPATGVTYEPLGPPGGFARGQIWRYLDRVEGALAQGLDVPFGISEPGHWMLLTAVQGEAPERSFLVSDPDGGRTAWVTENDFRDGSFADKQFHLCEDKDRPYVDSFIVPTKDS